MGKVPGALRRCENDHVEIQHVIDKITLLRVNISSKKKTKQW